MKEYKILNKSDGCYLAQKARLANGFFDRLMGLMFKEDLRGFDGLIIEPCTSIHTCFMRFNIDVLFLDSSNRIVRIYKDIAPWRMTKIIWSASKVLELKSGSLPESTQLGDQLEVICLN